MKIEKYISIEQPVEIDISSEDIQIVFSENDSIPSILSGVNSIAVFLRGIDDSKINEIPKVTQRIIAEFLSKEAARYNQARDSNETAA